jgi:hypothetical protein
MPRPRPAKARPSVDTPDPVQLSVKNAPDRAGNVPDPHRGSAADRAALASEARAYWPPLVAPRGAPDSGMHQACLLQWHAAVPEIEQPNS